MRNINDLNPLVAPIMPGDIVQAGDDYFLCQTNMRGKWTVRKALSSLYQGGNCWETVADNIDGQVALVGWFEAR